MRHTLPLAPLFYVTAPQPCPYLDDREERKLFTALQGKTATRLNDALSRQGFRRSQNVLYRPACAECSACYSARIRVADFTPSRSQRRVRKRYAPLKRDASTPWATDAQFALFRRYLDARHADGGMADMDVFEFSAMIEETPVRSRVIEYCRTNGTNSGRDLVAVCLTDVIEDGLSMVYSFFDPGKTGRSLGTYVILDHIDIARKAGLPFVYLGYWVPQSRKMHYKSRFRALEVFDDGSWQPWDASRDYSTQSADGDETVSDQVASLQLPELKIGRTEPE